MTSWAFGFEATEVIKWPNFKLPLCKYTDDFYGTLANSENLDKTPHIHKSLSLEDSVFC